MSDIFSRYLAYYVSTKVGAAIIKDWKDSLTSADTYPKFEQLSKFQQC